MVPETERYYASCTANAAGIPGSYISIERSVFDGKSRRRSIPEPRLTAGRRSAYDEMHRQMAEAGQQALLSGVGGDVLLGATPVNWRKFIDSDSISSSAQALMIYAREQRWLPVNRILATIRSSRNSASPSTDFGWLAPDFVRRADLRGRMARMASLRSQWRTEQERIAYDPFWTAVVSQGDPEFTKIAAKSSHPFFDVRLLRFATGISPLPWFVDKLLLREAMRGLLPEIVRKRQKTSPTLATSRVLLSRTSYGSGEDSANWSSLSTYVDESRLRRNLTSVNERSARSGARRLDIAKEIDRPISLAFWLKSVLR
jgi:asparagine synthase (glutamine-hydrolysing)